MSEELLKLENQICHRVYAVNNVLTRRYRPFLKELDLTYPQYVIMMALWEHKELQVNQLANHVKMDLGSVSVILKKMATKKYIKTVEMKKDRRIKIISLTAAGKKLKSKAQSVPEGMGCYVNSVTMKDLDLIKNLLDKLYGDLS
jgi:DNA-binding MarR family transcriptional regulator